MTNGSEICYNILRKQLLQNRKVHSEHPSELLIGGVVVEMHVAGGVYLLLGTEFCCCSDGVFFIDE